MDSQTLSYYAKHSQTVALGYERASSALSSHFAHAFMPRGRILDIGFGSGRDMAELNRQGYEPYGVDATEAFTELAHQYHPELEGRFAHGVLPDLEPPFGGDFDGVLCSAVIMHIEASELLSAALSIKRCLKVNGRLLISVPTHRDDAPHERDQHGRLFKTYSPGYLRLIFERLGFSLLNEWTNEDALARQGVAWVSLLFQLTSGLNSRPIDQILGVLNNDAKTATYKFALFRALADIAIKSPDNVVWLSSTHVGLPVRYVADKWLAYYWPLITSRTFIPQMNGERLDSAKLIRFRKTLQQLAYAYEHSGGYGRFRLDLNKGNLAGHELQLYKEVQQDLTTAIVKGPVQFAGDAQSGGRLFSFDNTRQLIIIPQDLWLELSQLGFWVGQAVILQWAEKSAMLSDEVEVAAVVNLLLDKPDERSTFEARTIFSSQASLECVWTGKDVRLHYEVDHVIPFDLWRNNDIWNLLPASRAANNQKRNKLPSSSLLKHRKDCIIHYWELLEGINASRFKREAETLLELPTSNWQDALFNQMCHAIEVTALQRGAKRWSVQHD